MYACIAKNICTYKTKIEHAKAASLPLLASKCWPVITLPTHSHLFTVCIAIPSLDSRKIEAKSLWICGSHKQCLTLLFSRSLTKNLTIPSNSHSDFLESHESPSCGSQGQATYGFYKDDIGTRTSPSIFILPIKPFCYYEDRVPKQTTESGSSSVYGNKKRYGYFRFHVDRSRNNGG